MAKKPTQSRAIAAISARKLTPIAGTAIVPAQIYDIPSRKPKGQGPWSREADKLAWTDPQTQLSCIILRQRDGSLSGFVAVPPSHILCGFNADAIPAEIQISAHGGLSYAQACDERGPEATRICHVRVGDTPDQWWFGFHCNKETDFVPGRDAANLAGENGQIYRTEGYVFEQCQSLAAQLAAIECGVGGDPLGQGSQSLTGVPLEWSETSPLPQSSQRKGK